MDISGIWKDLKTTALGVVVILAATVALLKGVCTFEKWWEIVLVILSLILGGGLTLMNSKKEPPSG